VPAADLGDGKITVDTTLVDRDRMLLIPGSSYSRIHGWSVPLSWASCVVLRGVFGVELKLKPGLIEWARLEKRRIDRAMELRELLELPPSAAKGAALIDKVEAESGSELRLRPFQRVDVAFLVLMETALLAQPMGAGKTATAIRTLQVLKAANRVPFPALIIAPNSVKATVWPAELRRWAPELSFTVVEGSAALRRKHINAGTDILIMNWEQIANHSRVAGYADIRLTEKDKAPKELNELGLRTVICDEAARLRAADSKQSRAVTWLLHRARYRYALTGTPVNNDAFDLWGILHAIAPDWHPTKTKYGERWVNTGYSLYGGLTVLGLKPETEPEFRQITQPLYRRLPKEIILPQLPPKLEPIIRHTPMTPKQAKAYGQMEKDQIAQLNDTLVAGSQLTVLTRLMQFAAAAASVEYVAKIIKNDDGTEYEKQQAIVTLEEPSGKIDDLLELLTEMDQEPLVVGAVSSQLINLAAARLKEHHITHSLVTGAQRGDERAEAVRAFQAGEVRVILLTLGAGAEGLTLTRARVCLLMQEDWRPDLNAQFTDRIHRIGSEIHDSIQVIRQITPGTVEERKVLVLGMKDVKIEEVLQDRATFTRLLGGK
jgi:SNF2 family DNA or RNA helicase